MCVFLLALHVDTNTNIVIDTRNTICSDTLSFSLTVLIIVVVVGSAVLRSSGSVALIGQQPGIPHGTLNISLL